MKLKTICSVTILAAAAALLLSSMPVQASKMDDRIITTARDSYVFKNHLQGDDIKVQSVDGAVTLTGIVKGNFDRSLIQATLSGIEGVKSVDNRLEIRGEQPTANSDAWLGDKVKGALLFHRSVSASTTDVNVKDGIVTLRGDASSQAQKELTAEYARDVDGITGVNNEMVVKKTSRNSRTLDEKIDDASITAQVNMTLLYHYSTSALNVQVETNRGVVTLNGKAGTEVQKDLVTKLAVDVDGVKNVKNRMTIE